MAVVPGEQRGRVGLALARANLAACSPVRSFLRSSGDPVPLGQRACRVCESPLPRSNGAGLFFRLCGLLASCADRWQSHRAMNKPSRSRARPLVRTSRQDAQRRLRQAGLRLDRTGHALDRDRRRRRSPPIRSRRKSSGRGPIDGEPAEPGTLVLRVEGPAAIEIQHLSAVILERVNRFFGWQAIGGLRLRQAPLRRDARKPRPGPDPAAAAAHRRDLARDRGREPAPGARRGSAPPSNRRERRRCIAGWRAIATIAISG